MEKISLLNLFYDNINRFNEKGCNFINSGEIKKAIEIYFKKIDYIRYAYEFNIIECRLASTMSDDTRKLIDLLENDKIDYGDYITIWIPKNASNFDVLRKIFDCKIINENNYELGITHLDLDYDTLFNTSWLKSKYKGGVDNETDQ